MQVLSNLNPDRIAAILLILCYSLVALGIIKIALFLIMTVTPGIWEKLSDKENAFYIRIGLLSEKGSETYKKLERGPWAKAFFGCGGLALMLLAILVIAIVRWMQLLPFWNY